MQKQHRKVPFAKKSLGQNFLVDETVIRKIVEAVDPGETDILLEIGPGRGALTKELIERSGRVYALEFDRNLADLLRDKFADRDNFTILQDDALKIDYAAIAPGQSLRLVANLPYNVSTAILQRLFDYPNVFADCVLMFQREVVDRNIAPPGTKDRGYLTVMTEAYFDVEKLFDVSPSAFRPVPKVWSSVARLVPRAVRIENVDVFHDLVATGFAQKRKTILNNLRLKYPRAEKYLHLSGIDPTRRAETLTLEEWLCLCNTIASKTQI